MTKLELNSRAELMRFVLDHGLLSEPSLEADEPGDT